MAHFPKSSDRITVDEYYIAMATLASLRSTCVRRRVGCILTDSGNRVLAVGYNGVPRGTPHCISNPCVGANAPSGTDLRNCYASHAEQNALISCKDIQAIKTAYVTTAPCDSCAKLFVNTSCQRIVYLEDYPSSGEHIWRLTGRKWERLYG